MYSKIVKFAKNAKIGKICIKTQILYSIFALNAYIYRHEGNR